MSHQMLCPCCKSGLEEGEMMPLESLEEHVCYPNSPVSWKLSYHCSNEDCETRKFDIVWSRDGEYYGGFKGDKSFDEKKFIDGNSAPFGTIARKLNLEIRKCGVPKNRELFTLFNIRFVQEFEYAGDKYGNILKKSWRLVKWKRDGGSWISYEFPLISFFKEVKCGFIDGVRLRKSIGPDESMSGLSKMHFSLPKWEDRWWRIWAVKVNRFIFPDLVKNIQLRDK